MSDACHICHAYENERHVYDTGPWFGWVVANVPGWVFLATKEHVEGIAALSPADAAPLGPAMQVLAAAVQAETGADRVQVVYLGENALHVHLGFFPRRPGEGPIVDNGPMLAELKERADAAAAQAFAERVRVAIAAAT